MDGYILTEALTPREFAELIDLDVELANLLYSAYAVDESNFGALLNSVSDYRVPLIDMFLFIMRAAPHRFPMRRFVTERDFQRPFVNLP